MKKKIYLLGAIILIVSIISSFAMTALANEPEEGNPQEPGEVTVTTTEKSEDDTTLEEPVSDPTTEKSEEKKKWSDLSKEELEDLAKEFIGKTSNEIKKYLAENYDISEEDINNFIDKVKDEENWSKIAEALASLTTTTKPVTTTKPTTTKAASSSKTTKKTSTGKKKISVATTLSEAEITTIGIEEEEEINVTSLKSDEYGVAVYPDRSGGYSFGSGSQLTVLGVDTTSEECNALVAASGVKVEDFIFLKDIAVSNYDGQKVKIAFNIGEQYKGQIVTVLHYHDNDVETFVTKVSDDGLVVIAVDSLSPFAIMLGQPEVSIQEAGLFGKIYEATGLSKVAVILIICAIVVLAAIVVVVIVINNDRKKKWAESHIDIE